MQVPIKLDNLFGAEHVASTKGPYWRIRQFAGFSFSGERIYSYSAVVQNLTSKAAEVTISFGFNPSEAAIITTTLVPAGALTVIYLPAPTQGKSFVVKSSQAIALVDFLGHQLSSGKESVSGALELPNCTLKRLPNSLVGSVPAGTSTQLLFEGASTKFLTLAADQQVAIASAKGRIEFKGEVTLLLEDDTLPNFWLLFMRNTNLSVSCKFFSTRDANWVPPSGLPVWVV
jgi:hypothetical protein